MLQSLRVQNFTVFRDEELNFSPGLNVIVGENGTGKTHILKLGYCAAYAVARGNREPGSSPPTETELATALAAKLMSVFRPDYVGSLIHHGGAARGMGEVHCRFAAPVGDLAFSFGWVSKREVSVVQAPNAWSDTLPVYLPTREMLTLSPGFVSLYETTHLPFEETWRDTSLLLGAPLVRGAREARIRELLRPLEEALNGTVETDVAGRFYLKSDGGSLEMHLVAEGLRKLAMIARLIATGALVDRGFLFWDEPEANLNPKVIKLVARTILHLAGSGIQVFIASHSLFLLRELDILLQTPDFAGTPTRFFGLHRRKGTVTVEQGNSVDDIGEIASLDENLSQSDRYSAVHSA